MSVDLLGDRRITMYSADDREGFFLFQRVFVVVLSCCTTVFQLMTSRTYGHSITLAY